MKVLKNEKGYKSTILIHNRVMKGNLDFPIDKLDIICENYDLSDEIKQWVIDNYTGSSTYEQIESYINDSDGRVRVAIARLSDDSLREMLIDDSNADVRYAIAEYGNDSLREKLINDDWWLVREAIARYGNDSLREKLINDIKWNVRRTVAEYGTNAQRDILINDPESHVRKAAEQCRT